MTRVRCYDCEERVAPADIELGRALCGGNWHRASYWRPVRICRACAVKPDSGRIRRSYALGKFQRRAPQVSTPEYPNTPA